MNQKYTLLVILLHQLVILSNFIILTLSTPMREISQASVNQSAIYTHLSLIIAEQIDLRAWRHTRPLSYRVTQSFKGPAETV